MAFSWLWLVGVVALAAALHHEEDFAFEAGEEEQEAPLPHPHPTSAPVQRLWGIPDTSANIGKLFHLSIPTDAFSGGVDHYEARGPGSEPLPSWLLFDKSTGVFEGVPSARDVGEHYVTVRAHGLHPHDWAKDVFAVEVAEGVEAPSHRKMKCDSEEDATVLTVVMDVKFEHLKPKQRVAAIKNLSGFLGLHHSLFRIEAPSSHEAISMGDAVVVAGPGNVKKRKGKHASIIQWQVGCEGHLWRQQSVIMQLLKQQARDGTLSEVLQQPVLGWHVRTRTSPQHRERRETGSGNYDEYADYEDEEEEEEVKEEEVPASRIVVTMASPTFGEPTASHPHRHHHGEELESGLDMSSEAMQPSSASYRPPTSPVYGTILPTPVLVPVRPTHLMSSEVLVEPSRAYQEFGEVTPSATPVFVTEVEPSASTDMTTSQETEPLPPSSTSSSTIVDTITTTNTSSSSTTTEMASTAEEDSTSTSQATTEKASTPKPTEEIEFDTKNIQPTIDHRLPKKAVTAGKALRYVIPEDVFSDLEDGNTRSLRLIFKTSEGTSVPQSSWIQFNPETQEVYALPLEEQVSKWSYIVEAMDKEGQSVSDTLEILVQHHKGRRTVNYEFSLQLRVEKKFDFPSDVDWQLRILNGLARLYGDVNTNHITVRSVTVNTDPVVFSWTNDSLPRSHCPKDEIDKLYKVLVVNEDGDPSTALKDILSPELRLKKVLYRGLGPCETPSKPEVMLPPPRIPEENFPPVIINQVDLISATVGELLEFTVPEDTCYDPEDGSTSKLKLSFWNIELTPIAPSNWLQFDIKNKQFYGIPMPGDVGRKEYQLMCEDKGKMRAMDGLVVVVTPGHKVQYSVEFSMTLDTPYDAFVHSASIKRKFVQRLRDLFNDSTTNAVVLSSVEEGSTVVTWHNKSLPTHTCPEMEVGLLRKVLMNNDGTISERVGVVLGLEFPVLAIGLTPTGMCQGELTEVHTPDGPAPPVDESQPVGSSDEYLVTFVVPAVIIAAMLVLAGIVACVLYRRRRTGKMNMGDEDERQSFRNKGIPVIFQDELEERPDPGNKSPVIMKEEKPPLPPPEYQRGEDERATPPPTAAHPLLGDTTSSEDPPYQPPPPFTTSRDSSRQNRPKPTPTYRKPPPYVPP